MFTHVLRRLVHAGVVIWLAVTVGFVVLHSVPGDAVSQSSEQAGRTDAAREHLRAQLALDQPLPVQYARYLGRVLRGDLGVSLVQQRPVSATLIPALINTLVLSGVALVLAVLAGMGIGVYQGWRPHSWLSRGIGEMFTAIYAVPEFILAVAMLSLLALRWGLFPVGGLSDPLVSLTGSSWAQFSDRVWHVTLPAMTLALGWCAAVARQQRVAVVQVAGEDFVRTAVAKGMSGRRVLLRHVLPNALISVIAMISIMLPVVAGGTVIVESLFAWPGAGTLMLQSVAARDYPVVSGGIIAVAIMVNIGALCADVAAALVDPRQTLRDV